MANAWPIRLQVGMENVERAIEILTTTFPEDPEYNECKEG
jgi:hypothetical protein